MLNFALTMRFIASVVIFASVCLLPLGALAQATNGFEARTLQGSKGLTLPYRLFKVKNPTAGTKYPLILFLHGAGERGDDNTAQLTANAGATVWATDAHQAQHPAYVVAPQCPKDKQWVDTNWGLGSYSITTVPVSDQLTTALEIADAIANEFGTDPARQYITGLSMGGYGTWDALLRNPTRFAAGLPICGAGDPSKAELIKLLPLWTFHGGADPTVPPQGSRDMVAALKAVGSSVKLTEYPGVGHNAWDMTYANEEVIDWLFTFKKESSAGGGSGGSSAGGSGSGGSSAGTSSAGVSASGGGGGGTSAGESPGGSGPSGNGPGGSDANPTSAGNPPAGTASSLAGASGSSARADEPGGEASSCSFALPTWHQARGVGAVLLGGCAAFARRRRRRALAA